MTSSLEAARAAKSVVAEQLAHRAEVNGIGIARLPDGFGVKVNLARPLPPDVEVPADVDGVPVVVQEIGEIRAF